MAAIGGEVVGMAAFGGAVPEETALGVGGGAPVIFKGAEVEPVQTDPGAGEGFARVIDDFAGEGLAGFHFNSQGGHGVAQGEEAGLRRQTAGLESEEQVAGAQVDNFETALGIGGEGGGGVAPLVVAGNGDFGDRFAGAIDHLPLQLDTVPQNHCRGTSEKILLRQANDFGVLQCCFLAGEKCRDVVALRDAEGEAADILGGVAELPVAVGVGAFGVEVGGDDAAFAFAADSGRRAGQDDPRAWHRLALVILHHSADGDALFQIDGVCAGHVLDPVMLGTGPGDEFADIAILGQSDAIGEARGARLGQLQ